MQRYSKPILALQHQAMKAGGVHTGLGIAGAYLSSRYIRRGIDRELKRNRQLREIDLISLHDDVVPSPLTDHLARNIVLASFAKCGRKILGLRAQTMRQQFPVAGDVRHHGHLGTPDVLKDNNRTPTDAIELEDD